MNAFSRRSIKAGTSRREFAKRCTAMAGGSMSASILQLQLTRSLLAQNPGNGFRALVCLFLDGGNDSFNMLVPHVQGEYDDYRSIRGDQSSSGLALERNELLQISTTSGRTFGLHPAMTEMHQLYQDGDLAFVANVGSLIEPTDMGDFNAQNRLPLGLFSHADLQRHWQTSLPQSRSSATGWGGRVADILTDPAKRADPIQMSISVTHINKFLSAQYANPYVVSAHGATERETHRTGWDPDLIFRDAFDQVLANNDADLLRRTYAQTTRQAIDAAALYNQSTSSVTINTTFPDNYFARSLEQIVRAIASSSALNHDYQIFFVSSGGWDHHGGLIGPQNERLTEISQGLGAFQAALRELNLDDQVTTFSASDFGRTLAGNGQGSDHGWGGNQFVLGGQVRGGDVYGDYPLSLAAGNPLDVGRGRLIPTMSVDEYAAELVMWMGIGNGANLETILPNIRNFYGSSSTAAPVGFLV